MASWAQQARQHRAGSVSFIALLWPAGRYRRVQAVQLLYSIALAQGMHAPSARAQGPATAGPASAAGTAKFHMAASCGPSSPVQQSPLQHHPQQQCRSAGVADRVQQIYNNCVLATCMGRTTHMTIVTLPTLACSGKVVACLLTFVLKANGGQKAQGGMQRMQGRRAWAQV